MEENEDEKLQASDEGVGELTAHELLRLPGMAVVAALGVLM